MCGVNFRCHLLKCVVGVYCIAPFVSGSMNVFAVSAMRKMLCIMCALCDTTFILVCDVMLNIQIRPFFY